MDHKLRSGMNTEIRLTARTDHAVYSKTLKQRSEAVNCNFKGAGVIAAIQGTCGMIPFSFTVVFTRIKKFLCAVKFDTHLIVSTMKPERSRSRK